MQKLVKLPNGNWVNPAHVTAIELQTSGRTPNGITVVWCKMDAGYGTGRIYETFGDERERLAKLINGES